MHSIMLWNPWREIIELLYNWNNTFEDSIHHSSRLLKNDLFSPPINVEETRDAYIVHAALPGITKDNINVSITENTLSISGERKLNRKDENSSIYKTEIFYGKFNRTIRFQNEIDPQKSTAKYENGILTIELPKSERSKPHDIEVEIL